MHGGERDNNDKSLAKLEVHDTSSGVSSKSPTTTHTYTYRANPFVGAIFLYA